MIPFDVIEGWSSPASFISHFSPTFLMLTEAASVFNCEEAGEFSCPVVGVATSGGVDCANVDVV